MEHKQGQMVEITALEHMGVHSSVSFIQNKPGQVLSLCSYLLKVNRDAQEVSEFFFLFPVEGLHLLLRGVFLLGYLL